MRASLHQRLYALQCVLLGIPTVVACGLVAVQGLRHADVHRHLLLAGKEGGLLLLWGGAGLLGLLAWVWLSALYLRRGRDGLRWAGALPWAGLVVGALAAGSLLLVVLYAGVVGRWQVLGYLVFGPLLLVPSAHLAWLRRSQGQV
ncbi:hypothetical protein ACLB90_12900 [Stenotrophomonas sp. LGBM10]|uniref:hypothetical protein n=1 Tax=Stenotrophomonas sp. LGBM10 TaxID=3390038 RepID=UPI00398A7132